MASQGDPLLVRSASSCDLRPSNNSEAKPTSPGNGQKQNKAKGKKKKNKNKTKNKRKPKAQPIEISYSPKKGHSGVGLICIPRALTEKTLPGVIAEKHIGDLYQFMCKSISIAHVAKTDTVWIFDFGLHVHDEATNASVYCVADRINPADNKGYQWQMRSRVYTRRDIIKLFDLPTPLPMTKRESEFKEQIEVVAEMEQLINDPAVQQRLWNSKVPWQHVPVMANSREVNKTQLKLTKSKEQFITDMTHITARITLVPILLFIGDGYRIDGLMRTFLNGHDFCISFRRNTQDAQSDTNLPILPSAIHVSLKRIPLMVQMADPHKNHSEFFDGWTSTINDMYIGNYKDAENRLNACKKRKAERDAECERLTGECDRLKQQKNGAETKCERLQRELLENSRIAAQKILSLQQENDRICAQNPAVVVYHVFHPCYPTPFYPPANAPNQLQFVSQSAQMPTIPTIPTQAFMNPISAAHTLPNTQPSMPFPHLPVTSASALNRSATEFIPTSLETMRANCNAPVQLTTIMEETENCEKRI